MMSGDRFYSFSIVRVYFKSVAIAANGAALSELDVAAGIALLLSPPAGVAVPVLLIDRAQLIAI